MKNRNLKLIFIYLIFSLFLITFTSAPEEGNQTKVDIPEGYQKLESSDGSLVILNVDAIDLDGIFLTTLNLNGNQLRLRKGSKLVIRKDGTIEIQGTGDIFLEKQRLTDIRDAVIKLDENGNIIFADFISDFNKEQTYVFNYNGKEFKFKTKKGTRVLFNPLENKIFVENGVIDFEGNRIDGNEAGLILDDEGNLIQALVDGGSFILKDGTLFSSNKGPLGVFFNKDDFSKFEGSAVLLEDETISMKGLVNAERLNKDFDYEGLTEDAYTEFDKTESFFDVQKGDCKFNNAKYEVLIEGGEAKLRLREKDASSAYSAFGSIFPSSI